MAKTEKTAEEMAKEEMAKALALVASKAKGDTALSVNEAGRLLASLDAILVDIAKQTVAIDPKAPVWDLKLIPIQVKLSDGVHKWVEVQGLDRNARIQIIDNGRGACDVHVVSLKSNSAEATAYFEALVGSSKELTAAVTTRHAIAGKTFNQVYTIAKAQEQKRIEKKYGDICPPVRQHVQTAKLVKKADIA
ncbi:MAG TPA: hypothetical protein VJ869_06520 [Sphaerochaeta sp.]|nr:hypothetical protein [Sphaerochaeta sp.]